MSNFIILTLIVNTVFAYTCLTQRWPFTIGDSLGNTDITKAELSGSTLFIAGTSSAADIKHASASFNAFVASMDTSSMAINWMQRLVDAASHGSGKITTVN